MIEYHRLIMEKMNRGLFLLKNDDAEGLATSDTITQLVKSGTAEELLNLGLIREDRYTTKFIRYWLTDTGRKIK